MTRLRLVTCLALALAVVCALAPYAQAQNPFSIDGTITDTNNSGIPGALKTTDPAGNSSELGPINGNGTKIGVINTAVPPMLGFTSISPKVDLNTIWTQTATSADGHIWFYFAWARDSSVGSGFISIEMEQSAAPAACNYTGVDQTSSSSSAALIAGCNPWQNRKAGDFLILWDQTGGSTQIYKRVFDGTAFGLPILLGTAQAAYSPDNFRGEAAIDMTADVFPPDAGCTSFANTIPSTVTGNSDTADYKDTVLAAFPPISNCGAIDVRKVTEDPSGNAFAGTGTFPYTIARSSGNDLRYLADFPTGSLKQITGTLQNTTTTDTYSQLIAGSDYTLVEGTPSTGWTEVSVACTVGSATTSYSSGSIPVVVNQITHCVITNKYVAASPAAGTTPSASFRVFDSASIVGLANLGTLPTTATFHLYSDANCQNEVVGSPVTGTVTYANSNTTATSDTGMSGIPVQAGTYYWTFAYAGNAFNTGFTTSCGSEVITVGATVTTLPTPVK